MIGLWSCRVRLTQLKYPKILDGKINEIGTYDELLSKPDGAFAEWMREHAKKLIEQKRSRESTIEGEDGNYYDTWQVHLESDTKFANLHFPHRYARISPVAFQVCTSQVPNDISMNLDYHF